MPQPSLERLKNEHWLPYRFIQRIPSDCQGVYLDMISMLQNGEGALVGSTAKALCTLVSAWVSDSPNCPFYQQNIFQIVNSGLVAEAAQNVVAWDRKSLGQRQGTG